MELVNQEFIVCFNSDMVRLELCLIYLICVLVYRFNSDMVRLEYYLRKLKTSFAYVSIPIWFD